MRNDAHDELEHIPSFKADPLDRDDLEPPLVEPLRSPSPARASQPAPAAGNGALWALILALVIALAGLGWWTHQQMGLMSQQLVATQENFARISEEASGRIQDITGKVVATESSSTNESESLKLRIKQLEAKLGEVGRQQQSFSGLQQSQKEQLGNQDNAAAQLAAQLKQQEQGLAQIQTQLKALSAEQEARKAELAGLNALPGQIKGLAGEVAALKKAGDSSSAIKRLEQDLLILRSELETRPAAQNNTAEFDAYRAQVTRTLNTLQIQIQNLQQQLDGR